jgi:hypothetical protein
MKRGARDRRLFHNWLRRGVATAGQDGVGEAAMVKHVVAASVVADLCGYPTLALNYIQLFITRPFRHWLGQQCAGAVG